MKSLVNRLTTNKAMILLCLTALFFGMIYIMKTNSVSGRGYELKNLDKTITSKKRELSNIQYQIALELSSARLLEKSAALGLQEPESLRYIIVGADSVALK